MTPSEWFEHVEEALRPYDTHASYAIQVSPPYQRQLRDDPTVWVGWYAVDPIRGALHGGEYGDAVAPLAVGEEFDPAVLADLVHASYERWTDRVFTVRVP